MLEELKKEVYEANLLLVKYGLVVLTWGNVSALDKKSGLFVIKPSGVSYDAMRPADMVIVDLDGKIAEGRLSPSSDTPTHIEIYKNFGDVCGITHTHSKWATMWAQAKMGIPPLGTTHADCFYGEVPCTRELKRDEIQNGYETNTGKVIVEAFAKINPMDVPAALVAAHGPFTWGRSAAQSVENALVLEQVAHMAYGTAALAGKAEPMGQNLLDKHFLRKHGKGAYYGQNK
jgi:L-ribulose-5-phosphate 4-epimerase